tara:strand:- start:2444 stop:2605 length:162 start_codon:yes stop_codon:yes gene_type:complete
MPSQVANYIAQLSDVEKIILKIAQNHLETSFNVKKSIGFKEWLSTQTPTATPR